MQVRVSAKFIRSPPSPARLYFDVRGTAKPGGVASIASVDNLAGLFNSQIITSAVPILLEFSLVGSRQTA